MAVDSASLDFSLLGDRVYEALKSEILTGTLRPRQRITVSGLAAQLGLSPTPVRDALKRLSADGLVDVRPRRGTIVAAFDRRSVHEIFSIRQIVESAATDELQHAPEGSSTHMHNLTVAMEQLRSGESFPDYAAFVSKDAEFHRSIVELLENRRLSQFYETLRWPILVLRGLSHSSFQRAEATIAEHRNIVDAVRRRDVEQAKTAVLAHLRNAEADLLRRIPGSTGDAEP